MNKPQNNGSKTIGLFLIILFAVSLSLNAGNSNATNSIAVKDNVVLKTPSLFEHLQLSTLGMKPEAFEKALAGYEALRKNSKLPKSAVLSIADLSQSSNQKRLYIIDVENGQLLMNTYVAHGRNSGEEFANSFSNKAESYQSSLGFYVTGETYTGKHGLSLQLKGQEQGINDNAQSRAIVIHGASYVSEDFIKQNGRLGRSQGCPAVSEELSEPVINLIKDGSCFFVYHPEKK